MLMLVVEEAINSTGTDSVDGCFLDDLILLAENLFLKLLEMSDTSHRSSCIDNLIMIGISGTVVLYSGINK